MAHKVKWSEKSKDDLVRIIDYLIDNWGRNSAKIFKKTVLQTIDLILTVPTIYPLTEYRENVRRCVVVKQVSMYYQINEDAKEIYIVRFYDNRRYPDSIPNELNENE